MRDGPQSVHATDLLVKLRISLILKLDFPFAGGTPCDFFDLLYASPPLPLSWFWSSLFPIALARDYGQWENSPPHVRRWFQGLKQPDNPRVSCCGEADAYEADIFEVDGGRYVAIITDGKGEIPNGTKIPVPNHKMKWDEGNPTGHGIIFIGVQGQVYCYVAPGGV